MRFATLLAIPLAFASAALAAVNYPFYGGGDTTVFIANSNGNVPLGIDGGGNYAIDAYSSGNAINAISTGGATAVLGYGQNYGTGIGANGYWGVNAIGYDPGTSGEPAGVYTRGVGGDIAYGIIADAYNGNSDNFSGFFYGKISAGGITYPSDVNLKKNIQPLQGGLEKVMALKPKTYEMKVEEYKDRLDLPKGKQYGLIAQELEQVLPELVKPVKAPPRLTDEERKQGVKRAGANYKSVDYNSLIPILIEAIQEQQAQIEALKAQR